MSNLQEIVQYDDGIYQIETTDPVLGGPNGLINIPFKSLANRTAWLKQQLVALQQSQPSLATQDWVQNLINALDNKQSVRAATTANINLTGLQTIDGVALNAGDRVLVKNQNTASQNGLYLASGTAWTRTTDADAASEVTAGLVVFVSEGTLQGNSRWQLVTDDVIDLGNTALLFQDVTQGYAPLNSPTFTGDPKVPTAAQFDNDTSAASTGFVQRAIGNFSNVIGTTGSTTLTAAHSGNVVIGNASGTITLPAVSALATGSMIKFQAGAGVNGMVIQIAGGDTIYNATAVGSGATSSITLNSMDTLTLVAAGNGSWFAIDGSALLKYTNGLAVSLSGIGYQKLPSGLIIQWGGNTTPSGGIASPTFPIAFPNVCVCVTTTVGSTGAGTYCVSVSGLNQSGFTVVSSINNGVTPVSYYWIAIGY